SFDEATIRAPFPSGWPLDLNEHLEDDEVLNRQGYLTAFYGHGGDELFARTTYLPAAADYSWLNRVDRQFFRIVLDDCRRSSSSFWQTTRSALNFGTRRMPWHPKQMVLADRNSLISHQLFAEAMTDNTHWHPLYQHRNHIQPAK